MQKYMKYKVKINGIIRYFENKDNSINYALQQLIRCINANLNYLKDTGIFNEKENKFIKDINEFIHLYNNHELEAAVMFIYKNKTFNTFSIEEDPDYEPVELPKINIEALNKINKMLIFK